MKLISTASFSLICLPCPINSRAPTAKCSYYLSLSQTYSGIIAFNYSGIGLKQRIFAGLRGFGDKILNKKSPNLLSFITSLVQGGENDHG